MKSKDDKSEDGSDQEREFFIKIKFTFHATASLFNISSS